MGTTRKDFCFALGWNLRGKKRTPAVSGVFFRGEHRLCVSASAGASLPWWVKKNWVRGVPLLGSEVLNLSAWAERGDKILLFPVNVIQTAETLD